MVYVDGYFFHSANTNADGCIARNAETGFAQTADASSAALIRYALAYKLRTSRERERERESERERERIF